MEQLSDEEVEVREEEEEEEDDSDKEDQDLDKMFGAWLGELDKLTQVRSAVKLIVSINTENLYTFMKTCISKCIVLHIE